MNRRRTRPPAGMKWWIAAGCASAAALALASLLAFPALPRQGDSIT